MPNDNSPDTTSRRRGIVRRTGHSLLVAGGLAGLVLGISNMANAEEATSGSDSATEEQHSGPPAGHRHDHQDPRAQGNGEPVPRNGENCDPAESTAEMR